MKKLLERVGGLEKDKKMAPLELEKVNFALSLKNPNLSEEAAKKFKQ